MKFYTVTMQTGHDTFQDFVLQAHTVKQAWTAAMNIYTGIVYHVVEIA